MIAPPGSVIDPYECPRRECRHPMGPDGAQEGSLLTGIIRRAAAASACAGHRWYILEGPVMALSSPTGADRERQQRIGYDAFAEPTTNERYLRIRDGWSR